MFDPTEQDFDEEDFERKDWTSSEFGHIDGKEEFPPNNAKTKRDWYDCIGSSRRRSCWRHYE